MGSSDIPKTLINWEGDDADDFLMGMMENMAVVEETDAPVASTKKPKLTKDEKREYNRVQRRSKRAEKRKEKKAQLKEERYEELCAMTEEERRAFVCGIYNARREAKKEKVEYMRNAMESAQMRIVFNCSFGDIMEPKELTSLCSQIRRVYAHIYTEQFPVQLHISSYDAENPLRHKLVENSMQTYFFRYHEKPYWEIFSPEETVVLSPDAEEELDEVDINKVYILGGLVDRTVKVNETRSQALLHGFTHRKLPLRKHLPDSKMCSVMNIDTVAFLLMDVARQDRPDWPLALETRIPMRKKGCMGRKGRRKLLRQERAQQRNAAQEAENEESEETE